MNFNYQDDRDSAIFIDNVFNLNNQKVKIFSSTVSGSKEKPNEDSYAIRKENKSLWIAVFDGTTSLKNIPTIKGSGARFSSHYLKKVFYEIKLTTPKTVLKTLNKKLLKKSKSIGGDLDDTHSLPASMGTVVQVDFKADKLEVAHIGDTYAVLYDDKNSSEVITDDRNQAFDKKMFELMKTITKEKSITNKEARKDDRVNQALVDMFIERNNNPNGKGSGIINGDPNMEKYIYSNTFSLKNKLALLVASDGLEIQGNSLESQQTRMDFMNFIEEGGIERLVQEKRKSEDNDPDWEYVRYKQSDDATGVYLKF